jgi:hypothetical protein
MAGDPVARLVATEAPSALQ